MYVKISKADEILARLKKEGKVKELNSPEDLERMQRMNEYMKEVHQDYLYKAAMSEISAGKVILNA